MHCITSHLAQQNVAPILQVISTHTHTQSIRCYISNTVKNKSYVKLFILFFSFHEKKENKIKRTQNLTPKISITQQWGRKTLSIVRPKWAKRSLLQQMKHALTYGLRVCKLPNLKVNKKIGSLLHVMKTKTTRRKRGTPMRLLMQQ